MEQGSNPKWDDECGFFRVRHFGVAKAGVNNSYDIINQIKRIVKENKDIHVWNISLGSKFEISQNYISPEAAALDEIQYENNGYIRCGRELIKRIQRK